MRKTKAPLELSDIVERARKGDQSAFGQLIAETENRLFRFCIVLCRNPQEAEEICQETYLKAFEKIRSLDKSGSFFDWLLRIAKNLYLDEVRSADHRLRDSSEIDLEALGLDERDTSEIMAIRQALSQFEKEDQYLLVLVDLEERSYSEAAGIMGLSEDAVRSRLFRVRKAFLENWRKLETK